MRVEYDEPIEEPAGLRKATVKLAQKARAGLGMAGARSGRVALSPTVPAASRARSARAGPGRSSRPGSGWSRRCRRSRRRRGPGSRGSRAGFARPVTEPGRRRRPLAGRPGRGRCSARSTPHREGGEAAVVRLGPAQEGAAAPRRPPDPLAGEGPDGEAGGVDVGRGPGPEAEAAVRALDGGERAGGPPGRPRTPPLQGQHGERRRVDFASERAVAGRRGLAAEQGRGGPAGTVAPAHRQCQPSPVSSRRLGRPPQVARRPRRDLPQSRRRRTDFPRMRGVFGPWAGRGLALPGVIGSGSPKRGP